jgi:hypothetical protein
LDWRFDGLAALVSIAAGKAADLVVLAGPGEEHRLACAVAASNAYRTLSLVKSYAA